MRQYTRDYYKNRRGGTFRSAKEIVPLVLEYIQPKQVIDVGCGEGTWLSVFEECGVEDILGVDGEWVDQKTLQIPAGQFLSFDLRKPLRINRHFDLVVSLEVAEHLPSECAATFVDSLTRLGPVVLFSAAIPFQGGRGHVNEQWPDYWVKLFHSRGYVAIDCLRRKIWQNPNVHYFYPQNILIFARRDYLESNPLLKREFANSVTPVLPIVHPKKYLEASDLRTRSFREVLSVWPTIMGSALKRRMERLASLVSR